MSSINTNLPALIAANNLSRANKSLQTSLQRLATGYRINSAADDPAGLIASESLRSDIASTDAAIANAQRAKSVIATAEGGLAEVSNLLISLTGLVTASANSGGLSSDELHANQLQVDSILSTINRISNATTFAKMPLLNGHFAFITSGITTASAFSSLSVHSANLQSGPLPVTVKVIASAQHAELDFLVSSTGLASPTSLVVTGLKGSVQLSFASAAKSSAIVASIHQLADSSGIDATLSSDNKSIRFQTQDFGAHQFVSVTSSSSAFSAINRSGTATNYATGRNASLTVNGNPITADGLSAHISNGILDVDVTLTAAANTNGATKTFGITGGEATFALGAQLNANSYATLGIPSIHSANIGLTGYNGQNYSLADLGSGRTGAVDGKNLTLSSQIITQAVKDISSLRGRLGAFVANELDSTINYLNITRENLASAESSIRDTDFAQETANLTRQQIIQQAAISILSIASKAPLNLLKLLG